MFEATTRRSFFQSLTAIALGAYLAPSIGSVPLPSAELPIVEILPDGLWHQVVCTRGDSRTRLFVDGLQAADISNVSILSTQTSLALACDGHQVLEIGSASNWIDEDFTLDFWVKKPQASSKLAVLGGYIADLRIHDFCLTDIDVPSESSASALRPFALPMRPRS